MFWSTTLHPAHQIRNTALVLAGFLGIGLAGCGSQSYPEIPKGISQGPHGGMAFELSDGLGYCELKYETKGTGAASKTELAVYFLQPDGKTAISPAPTDAQAVIEATGDTVKLQAAAAPSDDAGGARFIFPPGSVDEDQLQGELSATIDGKPAKVKFHFR
jgi:hypothetical protein